MINIGVLGSTNGTDLKAVLDAADNKVIDASVNIVISNRKNAYILKRSATRGVKTSFVSQKIKHVRILTARLPHFLRPTR